MSNEFSVVLFFPDDSYHYEKRFVDAETAVSTAKDFSNRPAARIGMIKKIIIADGGDCITFCWEYGKGITFPRKE